MPPRAHPVLHNHWEKLQPSTLGEKRSSVGPMCPDHRFGSCRSADCNLPHCTSDVRFCAGPELRQRAAVEPTCSMGIGHSLDFANDRAPRMYLILPESSLGKLGWPAATMSVSDVEDGRGSMATLAGARGACRAH